MFIGNDHALKIVSIGTIRTEDVRWLNSYCFRSMTCERLKEEYFVYEII